MKRSIILLCIILVASILSGCILSKTPNTNEVIMKLDEQKTFSVKVFPSAIYAWTLDGGTLSSTGNTYVYTAIAGNHTLVVKAKHLIGTDTQIWNIHANSPPVANTGPDQTVAEKTMVTLDASNSSDPDNDIVSYAWEQTGGTQVILLDPSAVTTTFQAPEVDQGGEALTFKLTVTDSTGLTSIATCIVNVTWLNEPPTANAGPDQTVAEGITVTLDASGSTDPDDGIASYGWEQTEGPAVTLSDASAMQPQFTAPNVGPTGAALKFELTVTDNGGLKSTATCIVNVTWLNEPPTANAGPDQTVEEGIIVTLDASGSTDPDDGIASYGWEQTEGPAVTLSDASAMQPQFTAPNVGPTGAALKFVLTVTDNGGLKSTATCMVNVSWVNELPTAEAGPDQSIVAGAVVTLNGGGSTDPDDGISSYQWLQTVGPSVTLINADTAIAQFTASVAAGSVLTFELTVTDAGGLQATDTCTITVQQPPVVWKVIDTGLNHTVAIKTDGSLWTWGYNLYGQLGDGTGTQRNIPTRIGTGNDWSKVAAGSDHTVAIKTDGSLWAWGHNNFGQLGDGTNSNNDIPTRIGTGNNWSKVAAGGNQTVAIKTDGSLWAWGRNNYGQLGDGTNTNSNVPLHIGGDNDWSMVSAGVYHTMAMKTDRSLWGWGLNASGQLGDGTSSNRDVPTHIGTDTDWALVDAGGWHTMAIKTDGSLWGCGYNSYGQLGNGNSASKNVPTQIGGDTDWAFVSGAESHTVAIKTGGSLWTWGYNNYGQLGDGTIVSRNVPTHIGTDTDWSVAVANGPHTLGTRTDGSLWAWGLNSYGELGIGTTDVTKYLPTQVYVP
jgi:alpha-tubulin suppressor-like RCC1 family protein